MKRQGKQTPLAARIFFVLSGLSTISRQHWQLATCAARMLESWDVAMLGF